MSVRRANTIVSIIVLLALLIQPLAAGAAATGLQSDTATTPTPAPQQPGQGFLFRASVTLAGSRNLARLEKVGVLVLDTFDSNDAQTALVLADGEQLADLARLGYRPEAPNELRLLVNAQGPEKRWLAEGLQPLLAQADAVTKQQATAGVAGATAAPDAAALQALRSSLRALTPEQIGAVASSSSVDDDADGLTNTQESWWCTDPMDTDTDDDGRTDGAEIQALKDWIANERASVPNETPWPSWPFNTTTCPDKDYDSIPNLAERWELGLNMDLESSDRDKFEDGQELFGVTYCPGGDLSCGYGDLPRSADSGYVGAAMPSWVKVPGKHPLVAAYPIPEVDVVESSLKVLTVTTITTDHTIASGTEKSYSTAKMEGTSTSVADTVTWNNWQEQSIAASVPVRIAEPQLQMSGGPASVTGAKWDILKFSAAAGLALCVVATAGGCAIPAAIGGAAVALGDIIVNYKEAQQSQSDMEALQADIKRLKQDQATCKNMSCASNAGLSSNPLSIEYQSPAVGAQDRNSGDRKQTGVTEGSKAFVQQYYQLSYPQAVPVVTTTNTQGQSWGGAHTTTNTEYEEHTITNGEAFSSEESWGNATAVDSAHSADLWFTYRVRNIGTEYAREIADLAFNVYIGDDPNPVYTYFVAPDLGGDGKFHNFMPGEEHTYTARHVPLTLEQMKDVDLGGPIRIVVEDFTYGADELFYEDAANAGVLFAMEDGTADGDETIDHYLIPTWGSETVLDVLARYFPHTTDADGMLTAVWTPEYRSDTPAWCVEPQVVGSGAQRTLWCKHALSTADWWNVYTDGMGDGSEGFQDTPASPGQVALFRFNKDSDLDGYSDRSELRLGTDPNDPADYPRPELIAGVHSIRSGRHVTATLSLLNTGLYDAYGVEVVMIAPNDTISITNNTVGGSGRVRAQQQVIVGSRILLQDPLPTAWTQTDHARPTTGGYYAGNADRTYTFTVQSCGSGGCDVGAGTWVLHWDDGAGTSGDLNFGAGYLSPNLLTVGAYGVKLGLLTGKVYNGESFTVAANTPRDTFQYTIAAGHETDFTPPVVLVSYNDPQGNHRFVVPPAAMSLSSPTADLMAFSGQMLRDPGVEIVTSATFTAGANTTDLVVNNPTETTLTDAHLFLEFIDPEGNVVAEVPMTTTLPAGPSVVPVAWDSGSFTPAYDPARDYIVMAFWTDYEGNILDTAARPLSSFQEDPKPAFGMATEDETWDFGTAQQGTLMQRQFTLASVGYADLLTHLGSAISITVEGPASQPLPPGDMGVYTVTVNTQHLPVGPFQETIPVRTSDPDNPTKDITVEGNVTPMPEDAPGGATLRPLDWTTTVSGTLGSWVEFTHTLSPDPQTLHPVKVYSQDYATLWGVGKYATPFGQGTASYDMFGDGRDGVMPSSGNLNNNNGVGIGIVNSGSQGAYTINVTDVASGWRINLGDVVLIHQTQGTGAGCWELNKAVSDYAGGTAAIQLAKPLQCNYTSGGNNHAQVQRVPQYTDCLVSGTVTPLSGWNGSYGGIFAVMCNGTMSLTGNVNVNGTNGNTASNPSGVSGGGFRSGAGYGGNNFGAQAGEGISGPPAVQISANGNGGGGAYRANVERFGGGGGGNGTGGGGGNGVGAGGSPGSGGAAAGSNDLSIMVFGGGGGGGRDDPGRTDIGSGGSGGGIALVSAMHLTISGSVLANGGAGGGGTNAAGGGGGAGGSVLLRARTAELGTGRVSAVGGAWGSPGSGSFGGGGASGRIHIEYCGTISGSTSPAALVEQLNCYIVEQIESAPYDGTRLNLPESTTNTYQVQYGRRFAFSGSGNQTQSIRMPKQLYATATMDALVSNASVSSGDLNLSLDIGADGTLDWAYNNTTTFPISFTLTSLASALNAYMVNQPGVAWGADIDVPMKLTINRQADVILTNLVLTLQSNQPGALSVAAADSGADRPLDWTVTVSQTQGTRVEFAHTMGPEPQTLHPLFVFDLNDTLKGLGKYAAQQSEWVEQQPTSMPVARSHHALVYDTDRHRTILFGGGNSTDCFGDTWEWDGYNWTRVATTGPSARSMTRMVYDPVIHRIILFGGYVSCDSNQPNAETWLLDPSTRIWSRAYPANPPSPRGAHQMTYDDNRHVVVLFGGWGGGIPYLSDTWEYDGVAWQQKTHPHTPMGVAHAAFAYDLAMGRSILVGGECSGGCVPATRDEIWGYDGLDWTRIMTTTSLGPRTSNALAYDERFDKLVLFGGYSGTGSASHVVSETWEYDGTTWTQPALSQAPPARRDSPMVSDAQNSRMVLFGGTDDSVYWSDTWEFSPGGRFIIQQIESHPYNLARLELPESGHHTYQIKYSRRYTFAAAGQATSYLRVRRQVYSTARLDILVNHAGIRSGNLDLCLDIGNDGSCDYQATGTRTFPLTLSATDLASAFNGYLVAQTAIPWGDPADVPVRVQVNRQADVMLTNLALMPVGAKTRFLRLPARDYNQVTLDILFGKTGDPAAPLAFTVDVGADGTVDWTNSQNLAYPATVHSPNLAAAFNSYLTGRAGEVDVPIRITSSPSLFTALDAFTARTTAQPDATLSASDISFGAASPVEGDEVTVSATLHNSGGLDAGRVTANFYATSTDWGEWYIGSAFVPSVPAGGTAQAEIMWNTLGFTGTVPMRVSIDPYNRLAETNEANNEASKSLTIRTRPDLRVTQIALSDDEPMSGESVTVTLALRNDGQTAAADSALALYDGNPDAGGTLVCERSAGVAGGGQMTATCTWTLATPGLHRLFARADRDRQVNEYDEGNNDTWRDVYVGFLSPILVDSGEIASDVAYTSTLGYGAVGEGQPDEFGSCGDEPWQTFRRDPDGRVIYRFDHLLPGHFYHLDLSLYLCGQAARNESVYVDGNLIAGPVALGDGQNHRLSLRLDPALYADRAISVTVETAGLGGAIVNEVNLYDVDYRYSDSGGANDPAYTAGRGYGYLNGVARTQWGTLPYRSLRENQSGNTVSYRYDGLLQSKRYQVWLSFWQNTGSPITQKVQVNGVDTGTALTIQSGTPYSATINVPTSYYVNGTITVGVVRTDASTSAMVNEISLEERTLLNLPAIRDVRLTNVSDTAATISWTTADPADGQVHYGLTPALGTIGQDERGPATVSRTHQATLLDLSPETGYYFYVTSADSMGTAGNGALYQFTTGPTLSLPSPDHIYGQVYNPDNSPAAGALVYVALHDADGQDSPGAAAPLSALVDDSGWWLLNLGSARAADLAAPFIYDPDHDRLDLSATQGTGCAANLTITTANDTPTPPMTLACPTQVTHSLAVSWNLVGLTVRTDPVTQAEEALDDIVAQGGSAIEVERWWNGGWDAHVRNLPFNNFTLDLGRGYFIRTTAASTWTRTGTPPTSPLPVELYPGWNLISFPKLTCSLAAEDVLVAMAAQGGACGEMDRWYAGSWQGHIKGVPPNNFGIVTDQGYFVKCTQRSTYIPCQATAQSAVTAWPPAVPPAAATPEPNPTISDVRVTNRRDVAFTVTWRTDRPGTGWVAYGSDGETDQVAHDDRGADAVGTLHHVTVTGLAPQTTYSFRIHAGKETADRGGMPFQVTTASPGTPAVPLTAYGQVHDAAGQPAAGALVRAWINDAAGAASGPLSALADGWGYWTLSLPAGNCSDKTLVVEALGSDGAVARMTQPACAESVQPAPTLTLGPDTRRTIYLPLMIR